MDIYRTFLAIILSFAILVGYQYLFVGFGPEEPTVEDLAVQTEMVATNVPAVITPAVVAMDPAAVASAAAAQTMTRPTRDAKTLIVDTDFYTAALSEDGGTITSFILKDYKETLEKDSPGMQMVKVDGSQG
ncbi:MAG: membrane protein insertase YidC, partial [Desulfocapsa sp.]|nr:membrane protein insertase YidC [Desulfocapsa sp.]